MTVTVKRYGGLFAMQPQVRTFSKEELDAPTRKALEQLLSETRDQAGPAMPDAFTYAFEVDDAAGDKKAVEVSGRLVPAALRKLLP